MFFDKLLMSNCIHPCCTLEEVDEGIKNSRFKRRLSFSPKKSEFFIPFKIDDKNCINILNSLPNINIENNDQKIDYLAFYTNVINNNKLVMLIELKGKKLKKALSQLESFLSKLEKCSTFKEFKPYIKLIIVGIGNDKDFRAKIKGYEVIFIRNPAKDRDIRRKLNL